MSSLTFILENTVIIINCNFILLFGGRIKYIDTGIQIQIQIQGDTENMKHAGIQIQGYTENMKHAGIQEYTENIKHVQIIQLNKKL